VSQLRGDRAHLCPLQRINETALPDVRIPNDADGDTLRVWIVHLYHPEEGWGGRGREVGALGGGGGAEGEGRVSEVAKPGLGVGAWDDIDLVQHEDELLTVGLLPPAYFFDETAAASVWVAGVEDEEVEVGLVDEFVEPG
jgi:hypothetical protein